MRVANARITNPSIVRNYTTNLNRNLAGLNKASVRVRTQRKFDTMAEDASSGVRAMQLRRVMQHAESYMDTAKTVKSTLSSAEGQMMQINDLGQAIAERYTYALNGTNSPDEMKTFVEEITQYRDQILNCANGKFSDRYLFGGTNTTERPFTVDEDGSLLYQGVPVKDMADDEGNVKAEYQYLFEDAYYVDLGMGIANNEDGTLIETTAFKASYNGLDFLGIGENNIYEVCNEIIDALSSGDYGSFVANDYTASLLDKITYSYKEVAVNVTDIGAQDQYLDYTISRFESEMNNMIERQDELEFIDPAEAIMEFKMQEYIYNAALQMGQRLLQPTLFNFIN